MAFEQTTPPGIQLDGSRTSLAPASDDGGYSISALKWIRWQHRFEDQQMRREDIPPEKYWLIDPFNSSNHIPTPVDEYGLVDAYGLVHRVKGMFNPDYKWGGPLSVHHLYPKAVWYGFPSAGEHALGFRELALNKILVPRIIENCIHLMCLPPDIPAQDVMQETIDSWGIHKNLYKSLREIATWELRRHPRQQSIDSQTVILPPEYNGEDRAGKAYLSHTLGRHFRGAELHMDLLSYIQPGFRLVQPDHEVIDEANIEKRHMYVRNLGSIVVPRAIPMTRLLAAA